jgi:nitrite reductase (NADH) large subunit
MAGLAALQEIVRKKNKNLDIVVFGDEPYPSYNRILLSEVLSGKRGFTQLTLKPRKWYEENGIRLYTGARVTEVDPVKGRVYTESGSLNSSLFNRYPRSHGFSCPYDKLLLATGSLPFIPPIQGTEKKGVFVYRTAEDVWGMMEMARYKKRAVVIGGGLLGLEAAKALKDNGMEVSVVHLLDRLMEQQLDFTAASLLKAKLERMGIRVLMERATEEVLGNGNVTGVRFRDGETVDADLVLICTGIRPNAELGKKAGLMVNRGVVVNDYLETSNSNIYAVGECVEHRGRTYGLFDPLIEQARIVADSIAGEGELTYEGSLVSAVLKVAGINLVSIGNFLGGEGFDEVAYSDPELGLYKKVVLQNNRVVGAVLMGDVTEYRRLFKLIKEGTEVSGKRQWLLWGDDKSVETQNFASLPIPSAETEESEAESINGDVPLVPEEPPPHYVTDNDRQRARANKWLTKMDTPRIKSEGLEVDFERYRREGFSVIPPEDLYRLKTYGYCSQKQEGYFMRRIRVPGGEITASQLEQVAHLAEEYGGWVHLTTRHNIELHWTQVENSEKVDNALKDVGLTTRSACGHTFRNITACEQAGICENEIIDVRPWVKIVHNYVIDNSPFLNRKLPRRLNVYFAGCGNCRAFARLNDIAFVAVWGKYQGAVIPGFEIWVGGSLGAKPHLSHKLLDFVTPEQALPAVQTITEIYTRHGYVKGNANPRLKVLIDEWGFDRFKEEFLSLFSYRSIPLEISGVLNACDLENKNNGSISEDGIYPQQQKGYYRVVVRVPLGELTSKQTLALCRLSLEYGDGRLIVTKQQNLEFQWVKKEKLLKLLKALREIGLSPKGAGSILDVQACSGTTFCIWGVSDSQGTGDMLIRHITEKKYMEDEEVRKIRIHISGCPNSCAQHQVAEIGLSGSNGKYFLYLGGHMNGGARVGMVVRSNIAPEEINLTLDTIIDLYLRMREEKESFAVFVERVGTEELSKFLSERLDTPEAVQNRARLAEKSKIDPADSTVKEYTIRFKLNGKTTTIKVCRNEKILQKGLDEGLPLPFSCQQGSCGTCKLRVKGKFHQGQVEGITPEEIASGYALICMAEPRGDMEVEV